MEGGGGLKDAAIIELYRLRKPEAVEESRKKYGEDCLRMAESILGNREDSEECVNDTWLRAWNSIPPHRPVSLRMYLLKLARRAACDFCRRRYAQKRGNGTLPTAIDELAECLGGAEDAESVLLEKELGARINAFVRDLPQREGNVFLRRYFFGESIEEIAKAYGMKRNHVAVSLHRSREKLRKLLEQEGYL